MASDREAAASVGGSDRNHEGLQNAGSCCGAVVFVDESTESVAPLDPAGGRWTGRVCRLRREEREPAVGALAVGVRRVDAEHPFEVAAAENQQPVETFGADGPHEALGVGVRLWRADRCVDDRHAFAAEDLVKGGSEFAVAVVDQEARPFEQAAGAEVARLLAHPGAVGLVVQPAKWTRRLPSSTKNIT
jgi:hypothetical protein